LQQISIDNLSKLDSSKNKYFDFSKYSLSPLMQNKKIFQRFYSTNNKNSNKLLEVWNLENKESIIFDSLEQAYEQVKFKFLGVSGVYKLTYKLEPSRFYIGSSNNLARRIAEYYQLTKGLRNPQSSSELEISKISALDLALEFIYITTPQTSLLFEQFSIIKFKPTINKNNKVTPRINPHWGNLDDAIITTKNLLSLYPEGSESYNLILVFLTFFETANNLNYTSEDLDNKYYYFLVYAYDLNSLKNKTPVIYSSVNRALKGLQISHSTLLNYIKNKYLFKSSIVLSFEPLFENDFLEYQEKPAGDNQMRKHIEVFNQDNELLIEFKSGREMAKYFNIDGKVARAAIARGVYQDFLLIYKEVSNRKIIYVFDSNSHELLDKLIGIAKALKYAKVNFYTLKNLIDSGNSYKGKIYSYKDKL